MVLQSLAFPDEVCCENSIYFRTDGKINGGKIALKAGQTITSDTYMNIFDMGFWRKYTGIEAPCLEFSLSGNAAFRILIKKGQNAEIFLEGEAGCGKHTVCLSAVKDGLVFFYIKAKELLLFEGGGILRSQSTSEKNIYSGQYRHLPQEWAAGRKS